MVESISNQAPQEEKHQVITRREIIKALPFVWAEAVVGGALFTGAMTLESNSLKKRITTQESRQAHDPTPERAATIVDLRNDYKSLSELAAEAFIATLYAIAIPARIRQILMNRRHEPNRNSS